MNTTKLIANEYLYDLVIMGVPPISIHHLFTMVSLIDNTKELLNTHSVTIHLLPTDYSLLFTQIIISLWVIMSLCDHIGVVTGLP